ncbi:MAG: hypothetical protein K8M05_39990 [Deltaproteobacteria bacterium]|nr:hypothetical protein [Kofleriaceae bacterium]
MRGVLAVAVIAALVDTSAAEPGTGTGTGTGTGREDGVIDLRAKELPFVARMTMRAKPPVRTAQAARPVIPRAPADDPLTFAASRPAVTALAEPEDDILPTMRAQLVLGFAVDGAEPSPKGLTLAGNQIGTGDAGDDAYRSRIGYARARAYAFGDAFLGVDRIVVPGLSAYLASQFRIVPTLPTFAPVPTAWDSTADFQFRAGWAEADGVFERGPLSTLVVRGGRQHVYGPVTAHIDGLWLSWSGKGLRMSAFAGARVPAWWAYNADYPDLRSQRGAVTGGELTVDMRRFELPFVLRLRALAFENHGHADATFDWNARKDLLATGTVRTFDGAIAHESVTLRYRLSEETRLVVDGNYRHRRDMIWDYAFRDPEEPYVARRYLDRGPSLPRATARARAGTVLLSNIDLLLHGGFAVDTRLEGGEVSYHSAGWLEAGSALEIRVRRAIIFGAQGLWRTYRHRDPDAPVIDVENVVQPLDLPVRHVGERNMVEGGVVARFSGGARKFSAAVEVFVRRTRWAELYRDDGTPDPQDGGAGDIEEDLVLGEFDLRGGGRVSFDAWVTQRLRLRAEYDLSSALDWAPEIRGLKSLRILAEGQF